MASMPGRVSGPYIGDMPLMTQSSSIGTIRPTRNQPDCTGANGAGPLAAETPVQVGPGGAAEGCRLREPDQLVLEAPTALDQLWTCRHRNLRSAARDARPGGNPARRRGIWYDGSVFHVLRKGYPD